MKEWMQILIRSLGLFFLTFLLMKVVGKKYLAKLTTFQLINYIVIAILTALISVKVIESFSLGLLALAVWLSLCNLLIERLLALAVWIVMPVVFDYLAVKSKAMHDYIYGKETVLIKKGKVMEENLKKVKLTGEELIRELRSKNAFNLADVEFAVLETTGEINVTLKSHKLPVTPKDLESKVAPRAEPQTVILDGNILHDSLNNLGLNEGWLKTKLKGMGIDLTNVYIGQVDSSGDLYVDLFDDMIQIPQSSTKEMLYAGIEKCQADFIKYALETKDEKAKKMYAKHAKELEDLMNGLKPYLLH